MATFVRPNYALSETYSAVHWIHFGILIDLLSIFEIKKSILDFFAAASPTLYYRLNLNFMQIFANQKYS